ncbi:Protein of unknown function DUF761 [Macleaya cordata]|uniref:Uncharacterized protein n=1 Tax=Macleaya cordata TaxID=56857 RepID=A0A200PW39_MACCD|nr:Protein of unknown function DUF761 [Macleaya cordata]
MSSLKFGKKLLPATKAWKSFTSTLQKKLHKLKKSKAIKKTTKRINKTFSSILRRKQSKSHRLRFKRRVLHQHHQHNYAPVFIDELFMEPPLMVQSKLPKLVVTNKMGEKSTTSAVLGQSGSTSTATTTTTTTTVSNVTKTVEIKLFDRSVVVETSREGEKGAINSAKESLSAAVWPLHQLRGVDERAEQFIAKFKEEMRLQR